MRRAQGRGGQARRHARGAQVDHLRQRRVHQHRAAAAERSGRGDAGHRQSEPQQSPRAANERPRPSSSIGRHARRTCADLSRRLNRNNTSIYAVDPRGLAAFEYDINQGVGLQVDQQAPRTRRSTRCACSPTTPTAAPSSTATISRAGMKQIIRDSSGYYLLGYNSTQAPTDGRFHTIDVKVKRQGRRRARAQGLLGLHRGGCCARRSAAEARGAAGGRQRADHARRAAARPPGAVLDRHRRAATRASRGSRSSGSRSRRRPASAPARRRGRVARDAHRAGARRPTGVPRPGAGTAGGTPASARGAAPSRVVERDLRRAAGAAAAAHGRAERPTAR